MSFIDQETSEVLFQVLQNITEIMEIARFADLEAGKVSEIARKSRLTFYDASYVSLAYIVKEALVTDDRGLAAAAHKLEIEVYSAANYHESKF
jgi:predicted nucleic acid-binding protein